MGPCVFRRHGAQLYGDGYTILPDFAEYLPPPDGLFAVMASIPPSFPITTFDVLYAAVYKKLSGEVALHDKQNRSFWRFIVNAAVETQDEESKNAGAARYSLEKALLFRGLEREGHVWTG